MRRNIEPSTAMDRRRLHRRRASVLACALVVIAAPHFGLASPDEKSPAGTSRVGYGPLTPDPKGVLDLPRGFSYRVYSTSRVPRPPRSAPRASAPGPRSSPSAKDLPPTTA